VDEVRGMTSQKRIPIFVNNAEHAERRLSSQRKTVKGFKKKPKIQDITLPIAPKKADKKLRFITDFLLSDFTDFLFFIINFLCVALRSLRYGLSDSLN
jgi:hypothetical protein